LNYSVESSIADLVDNSITAGANAIWISFRWNSGDPVIEIRDDGSGMNADRLAFALRLAGDGPQALRDERDLGRFGLGLKTASIAHCRRLTVTSSSDGEISNLGWDLDELCSGQSRGRWSMTRDPAQIVAEHVERLGGANGTIVRWRNFDYLLGGADPADREDVFNQAADRTSAHLGMTFSRFLLRASNPLRIECNGREVELWDPSLEHLAAVWPEIRTKREDLPVAYGPDNKTRIQATVLPRRDEFPSEEMFHAAGRNRWNSLQGFFVYRNDRLIYDGGDLGLGFEAEEHSKLGRVIVDIPNSDDSDWALNVTKEALRPPRNLEAHLKTSIRTARQKARARYRRRGPRTVPPKRTPTASVWTAPDLSKGAGRYKVNLRHPAIKALEDQLDEQAWRTFKLVIKLVEQSLPIEHIAQLRTEEASSFTSRLDVTSLRALIVQLIDDYRGAGQTEDQILNTLHNTQPFNGFPDVIEEEVERSRPSASDAN